MNKFNIHAVSFISMTLREEYYAEASALLAWDNVMLYDDGGTGHVVVDDENLSDALMYQIIGFCRYHGISHEITSGTLPAVPPRQKEDAR